MEIKINPDLLYAFAQTNDSSEGGHQFRKNELHCRIINAETDEGYTVQNKYVMELYGRINHDNVFYRTGWDIGKTSRAVELFLRHQLVGRLERARIVDKQLERLLKALDIE